MRAAALLAVAGAVQTWAHQSVNFEKYRLQTRGEYVRRAAIAPHRLVARSGGYLETASQLVADVAPEASVRLSPDHYVGTNGMGHVYYKQIVNGREIDNAGFSVNIGRDGTVFSYNDFLFKGEMPMEKRMEMISAAEALDVVRETLGLPLSVDLEAGLERRNDVIRIKGTSGAEQDPEAKLVYFAQLDGSVDLAWKVWTDVQDTSLASYVRAQRDAAEVIGVVDYVDRATYEVFPFPINDPTEGERVVLEDTPDANASPMGWHFTEPGDRRANATDGNNVISVHYPPGGGGWTADSETYTFQYPYDPTAEDPRGTNQNAAFTQVFWLANMLHDLYYILGWDEVAGNCQDDNFDKGGAGNDKLGIRIQDYGGWNNGFIRTSRDGFSPTMTLYLFNKTDPLRDVSFDNGFVIHEYTHALSARLTGGPANDQCLQDWEADGMAEGWSDAFAAALMLKPEDTEEEAFYGFAAWPLGLSNDTARIALYSTNLEVNNLTYSDANGREKVHEVGTVFATPLYDMMWNLINKYGKNDAERPEMVDGVPTDGKFLTLKILLDSFAIQPCNPTFIQSRDAIIDADEALTGGNNACEIWTAFARRGMGLNAVTSEDDNRVDNFDLPEGVCT